MARKQSEYDVQAREFLNRHPSIRLQWRAMLHQEPPSWCEPGRECGVKYEVSLMRVGRGEPTGFSFEYWGSIASKRDGRGLTPYAILSTLGSDSQVPDTFEMFCFDYGYDEDSRKAFATFERCREYAQKIREFFDDDELEELQRIQ